MNPLQLVIITGVSGGGKTTALRAVEDLGFYCVDNLPLPLLSEFIATMTQEPTVRRVALVVDARLRQYVAGYAETVRELAKGGHLIDVVFLDAKDDVLVRRFSYTRRRHPLGGTDLHAGLAEERRLLAPLWAQANVCIDTSALTPHELKQVVQDRYERDASQMVVSLLSFGFRYGLPSHADLVLDVRFLDNPYFVEELRPLSGKDPPVVQYVLGLADTREFLARSEDLLRFLLPRYEAEGKVYLTVAVGCSGGRHRSVAIAAELAARLGEHHTVHVRHRDVDRLDGG